MVEVSDRCIRSSAAAICAGEYTVTVRDWVRSTRSASPGSDTQSRISGAIGDIGEEDGIPCIEHALCDEGPPGYEPGEVPAEEHGEGQRACAEEHRSFAAPGDRSEGPLKSEPSRCRTSSAEAGRRSRSFSRHCIRRAASGGGQSGHPG